MRRRSRKAADKRKWDSVRQELDRTQSSVQGAMNELQDQKLSQLVSLGGWLRGTQILTAVVSKHFTQERRRAFCINRTCSSISGID